jgi:hypothetical protein
MPWPAWAAATAAARSRRVPSAPPWSAPVIAAIARHITESGSVFLELPDGPLTVVLLVDGKTWIAQPCDEAIHG